MDMTLELGELVLNYLDAEHIRYSTIGPNAVIFPCRSGDLTISAIVYDHESCDPNLIEIRFLMELMEGETSLLKATNRLVEAYARFSRGWPGRIRVLAQQNQACVEYTHYWFVSYNNQVEDFGDVFRWGHQVAADIFPIFRRLVTSDVTVADAFAEYLSARRPPIAEAVDSLLEAGEAADWMRHQQHAKG